MWDDPLKQAAELRAKGEPFVLATVVACRRPTSAYPGAKAIIGRAGAFSGWVGGSCREIFDRKPESYLTEPSYEAVSIRERGSPGG